MSDRPAESPRDFAAEVVRRLVGAGYEALWAGGCVRDHLLGLEPGDYDVATNATPDGVREVFGRRRTIPVGESFGVIIVRGPRPEWNVEVATFRADLDYEDGRRPTGVVFTTAEEDAKRRDFTINGMFFDPLAGHVVDYVGGETDLGRGIVRAIGEPRDRIREDKLRMLRAVRFAARFEFDLDPATADAIRELAGEVTVVSVERIAAELRKMLLHRHRRRAIEALRDLGLLAEVLPEVRELEHTLNVLHLLRNPSFELALAALLLNGGTGGDAARVCRRLRLSNDETDRVAWLVAHRNDVDAGRSLPLHVLKPLLAHPGATDLLALARVDGIASNTDLDGVLFCEEYFRETPREVLDPPALVTGRDLIDRGLTPGPRFKELLETLRNAQLDERLADRDDTFAELDRLLGGE